MLEGADLRYRRGHMLQVRGAQVVGWSVNIGSDGMETKVCE